MTLQIPTTPFNLGQPDLTIKPEPELPTDPKKERKLIGRILIIAAIIAAIIVSGYASSAADDEMDGMQAAKLKRLAYILDRAEEESKALRIKNRILSGLVCDQSVTIRRLESSIHESACMKETP